MRLMSIELLLRAFNTRSNKLFHFCRGGFETRPYKTD